MRMKDYIFQCKNTQEKKKNLLWKDITQVIPFGRKEVIVKE